jgi:oligoendopeptidase F
VSEATAEGIAWDLGDLYTGPDDPELERDAAAALEGARDFRSRYADRIAALAPTDLAEATAELERITALAYRVRLFTELAFDSDTQDDDRARRFQWAREQEIAVENEVRFFELEWAAADDAVAEAALSSPELESFRHFLTARRRFRPYLLSEGEERVAAEKSLSGTRAWERLFSDLVSQIRIDVDGADLSLDEARSRLITVSDRDQRRRIADAISAAIEPTLRTRALVLNTIVHDRAIEDRLRGFPTWLSARNLANEISDEAADALIEAVARRYDIAHRHFRLRARLLGLPRLADYDRWAPVGAEVGAMTWDEARALALEAFESLSPEAVEIAERFFERRWIDADPRPGKVNGAYCAMRTPGAHPYILMNFGGSREGALTLAHELGHGLQAVLSADIGFLSTDIPLTMVETASTLAETLAFERLMARVEDPSERLALLISRIDNLVGTTFGCIMWYRFEEAVHTTRREEGELSLDRLNELFDSALELYHGDAVETTGGFRTWWSYVPHFIVAPGYMYAYAFGGLLSLGVYARYREEGAAFVPPLFEMLSRSASEPTERLAGRLGLDLADPALWESGLDAIEALVADAEALADSIR